jgi:hypothetical protein
VFLAVFSSCRPAADDCKVQMAVTRCPGRLSHARVVQTFGVLPRSIKDLAALYPSNPRRRVNIRGAACLSNAIAVLSSS